MKTYKIIIEDLELIEAKEIMMFIINAVECDDLPFSIQDCLSIEDSDGNVIK